MHFCRAWRFEWRRRRIERRVPYTVTPGYRTANVFGVQRALCRRSLSAKMQRSSSDPPCEISSLFQNPLESDAIEQPAEQKAYQLSLCHPCAKPRGDIPDVDLISD
jgi:hypothetical protein